jgi:hypothetical protein
VAAVTLTPEDLEPFATISEAKAEAMITDALAMAARVAPCILDEDFEYADAAKAILRRAIIRWHEAGSGAAVQQTAGPFSQTIESKPSRGLFWPSEIEQLQELCQAEQTSGAFTVDGICAATIHADVCSLNFGALYCSCGADIAGYPLWEVAP